MKKKKMRILKVNCCSVPAGRITYCCDFCQSFSIFVYFYKLLFVSPCTIRSAVCLAQDGRHPVFILCVTGKVLQLQPDPALPSKWSKLEISQCLFSCTFSQGCNHSQTCSDICLLHFLVRVWGMGSQHFHHALRRMAFSHVKGYRGQKFRKI